LRAQVNINAIIFTLVWFINNSKHFRFTDIYKLYVNYLMNLQRYFFFINITADDSI